MESRSSVSLYLEFINFFSEINHELLAVLMCAIIM